MSEQYPGGPPSAGDPQTPPPPPGHAPPPTPGQAPYGHQPYGQAPYGQQPHGQAPFGQQPPAGQAPYGQQHDGQQPHYASPAPGFSRAGQPADLGVRFVARLIDGILMGIVGSIVGLFLGAAALNSIMATGQISYGAVATAALVGAAISLTYYTLMEARFGQTLGKMLMKIRTVAPNGGNPTPVEALKRNFWTGLGVLGVIPGFGATLNWLLSLLVLITISVTINGNPTTRQGWHDQFAGGTRVVRTG